VAASELLNAPDQKSDGNLPTDTDRDFMPKSTARLAVSPPLGSSNWKGSQKNAQKPAEGGSLSGEKLPSPNGGLGGPTLGSTQKGITAAASGSDSQNVQTGGADGLTELRRRDFVKEALQPEFNDCVPISEEDALEYAAGTGVAGLPMCPIPFRQMAPPQVHELLVAHCTQLRTWWAFTWDLLRSPPTHFEAMCEWLQNPEHDAVGEPIRSMAVGMLKIRERAIRQQWRGMKEQYQSGAHSAEEMQFAWEEKSKKLANVIREFVDVIYAETVLLDGRKHKEVLGPIYSVFTDKGSDGPIAVVEFGQRLIEDSLAQEEAWLAAEAGDAREWMRRNFDILRGEQSGLVGLLWELKRGSPGDLNLAAGAHTEEPLPPDAGALQKLADRNFVQEASGLVKDLQLGLVELQPCSVAHYLRGAGVGAMPSDCVPKYREMTPKAIYGHLVRNCNGPTWWLFTLDLLRSPKEYFDVMCVYFQQPALESVAAPIRSMAVGALRVRANELSKLREGVKREFDNAVIRRVPATKKLAFERWIRLLVDEAHARAGWLGCVTLDEARTEVPQKYTGALPVVYSHFIKSHGPGKRVRLANVEEVLLQGDYQVVMLDEELGKEESLLAGAGEGDREWLKWTFDLLRPEREKLGAVLDELRFGATELQTAPAEDPECEPVSLWRECDDCRKAVNVSWGGDFAFAQNKPAVEKCLSRNTRFLLPIMSRLLLGFGF
jgi:hypothetical protein